MPILGRHPITCPPLQRIRLTAFGGLFPPLRGTARETIRCHGVASLLLDHGGIWIASCFVSIVLSYFALHLPFPFVFLGHDLHLILACFNRLLWLESEQPDLHRRQKRIDALIQQAYKRTTFPQRRSEPKGASQVGPNFWNKRGDAAMTNPSDSASAYMPSHWIRKAAASWLMLLIPCLSSIWNGNFMQLHVCFAAVLSWFYYSQLPLINPPSHWRCHPPLILSSSPVVTRVAHMH
ncbi:hypothetical protein V8C26DRAFT_7600 [Trichoderma gracile]